MITVAVVNSKGGVGKTTLAAALAVRAAQDGKRVCVVDLDPQKSLVAWWERRGSPVGRPGHPEIFEGVDSAVEAVERAKLAGWDWCFLDGPPAFLHTMEEMISASDFTLIPTKPSVMDLHATEDAVVLARDSETAYLIVFNDVGTTERLVDKARALLKNNKIPVAGTQVFHRVSHITGMNAGKTAAEVNGGKDVKAKEEIDNLWQEVKVAATKAAKRRAKAKVAAHV
jgi:chromosome partitioning protein